MISLLAHLFVPRESNNHRSKLLHHKSIFILILLIVIFSLFIPIVRKTAPNVLGIATNIVVEDLLSSTNQERQEEGIPPLVISEELSKAAKAKARDMFTKNYWAHNAPDGTTPWVFIQKVGYDYVYAGENLAKDFNDSQGVVNGWMASPSHRENMLSHRYNEVGFAVVNGKLNGEETTLIVEMLGRRQEATIPASAAASVQGGLELVAGITNEPLIDSQIFTKRLAVGMLAALIIAFILDMIYIERNKLFRLVGHNADHIIFLTGAIMLLLFFGKGVIL